MMIRLLPAFVLLLWMSPQALGQQTIQVSTFSIAELSQGIVPLPLPVTVRQELAILIDQAQRAYDRGARPSAVAFLGQFAGAVESEPESVIPAERAEALARRAGLVIEALEADLSLGGAEVGRDGAVLRIADTNSPLFGAQLTIPEGAIPRPTFVSMSVREAVPANRVLTFAGSGLVLGPERLQLSTPATLRLPYADENQDDVVDGTDFSATALKVGAVDSFGRIAFPRRVVDLENQVQTVQLYEFSSYWSAVWRWAPGVLTYKLSWPSGGVAVAPGFSMDALRDAVRSALNVWAPTMAQGGFTFQEVSESQPAAIRFGFFSSATPMSVFETPGALSSSEMLPGLARGLGDGAAQVYALENPLTAGEGFAVAFNSNFGATPETPPSFYWTPRHEGDMSAVSIEAVAVHALGHVLGLDDIPDTVQPPVMATGADLLKPEVCLSPEDVEAVRELYRIPGSNAFPSCPHSGVAGLPGVYDFGVVPVGSDASHDLVLENGGTGTLVIRSIIVGGDFQVDVRETEFNLRAGESTAFSVRFAPTAPGSRDGLVSILSNAPGSPNLIQLSGSGPYEVPDCTLIPGPARITNGEPAALRWTVANQPETGSIDGDVGPVDLSLGSVPVAPVASTAYTMTVSNQAGTATCAATIEVTNEDSSEVVWARQFGTAGEDAIRTVSAGDYGVFVAGEVGGEIASLGDAFLSRYDTGGDEVWSERFGGARIEGLAVDATGVYVAGLTEAALPGEVYQGSWDVFVRKYGFDGRLLWTDQFGSEERDRASAIAVDASGVYVAGVTEGGLGSQDPAGNLDVFVRKYSLAGVPLWIRQFGTAAEDFARDVEATPSGVVVVGDTGAALTAERAGGGSDAFVRQYSADGEELWTEQFGGPGSEFIAGVAVDRTGFYVAGATETALEGQVGLGEFDAFLRKYAFDGAEVWTRQFGTSESDSAAGVGADSAGVFIVGATGSTLPGQVSFGQFDAFVRAYDPNGAELWTRHVGTPGVDDGFSISPYGLGVYVVGSTLGAFEGFETLGSSDGYIVKIRR